MTKFDGKLQQVYKDLKTKGRYSALSRLKCQYNQADLKKYLPVILRNEVFSAALTEQLFPTTYENIGRGRSFKYRDFERELLWAALLFSYFESPLSEFLRLEHAFNDLVQRGNNEDAAAILDEIEEKLGKSVWLAQSRILLADAVGGLEQQKEMLKNIVSTCGDYAVSTILEFTSTRFEPNVSPDRYKSSVEALIEQLKRSNIPEKFIDYIAFNINPLTLIREEKSLLHILLYESTNSLIDYYLTCVRILQVLALGTGLASHHLVLTALKNIPISLRDERIDKLRVLFMHTPAPVSDPNISEAFEDALSYYAAGEYAKALEITLRLVEQVPHFSEIFEVAARCIARLYPTNYKSRLERLPIQIGQMTSLLLKSSDATKDAEALLQYGLMHARQYWFDVLLNFIRREYQPYNAQVLELTERLAVISGSLFDPRVRHELLAAAQRHAVVSKHAAPIPWLPIHALIASNRRANVRPEELVGLTQARREKYLGILAFNAGNYAEAIGHFAELADGDVLDQIDNIRWSALCLNRLGRVLHLLELVVESYLTLSRTIVHIFPMAEIRSLVQRYEATCQSSINTPIFFELFSQVHDVDKENQLAWFYEIFLERNGVLRPSMMPVDDYNDSREKLIYFLHSVCIPEVLDSSYEFESTEDVLNERIQICQLLTKIDAKNARLYSEEIKDITKRIFLLTMKRKIDESKIFIDVDSLKKSLEKSVFRDNFNRLVTLLITPQDESHNDYVEVEIGGEKFQLASNGIKGLFSSMLMDIRDKFLFSNEYGLDAYLSVRVRHGTLTGEIMKCFDRENLISPRNAKNQFVDNAVWKKRFQQLGSGDDYDSVKTALDKFTQTALQLRTKLVTEWLQVKTETKNKQGLFDFVITVNEYEGLLSAITPGISYADFVDLLLEHLTEQLNLSLIEVQTRIKIDLKAEFQEAFAQLLQDLANVPSSTALHELRASVTTASTALQNELDMIANWFQRSTSLVGNVDLDIQICTELCLHMVRNVFVKKYLTLEIENDVPSTLNVKGAKVTAFVDALYILFSNICEYGKSNDGKVQGSVAIRANGTSLHLRSENILDESLMTPEYFKKLDEARTLFNSLQVNDKVRSEGGTGLLKLKKLLTWDLEAKITSFSADVIDEKRFVLDLQFTHSGFLT